LLPQESAFFPDVGLPANGIGWTMGSVARTETLDSSSSQTLKRSSEYDVQVQSHTNRLYASGRFRKTVTHHLSQLAQPGAVPSRATSRTNLPRLCRSEQVAMFYLSAKTCRTFTLAEVLIMAALNSEDMRIASEDRVCTKTAEMQRGCLSARHSQVLLALPA